MKRYLITGVLVVVLLGLGIVHIIRHRPSQGLSVGVVVHCVEPDEHLRMIRLRVNFDGRFVINDEETIDAARLTPRLAEVYASRSERLLFFDAVDSATYQQAVSTIEAAQTAVPGLRVMLITPSTRGECTRGGIIRRIPAQE